LEEAKIRRKRRENGRDVRRRKAAERAGLGKPKMDQTKQLENRGVGINFRVGSVAGCTRADWLKRQLGEKQADTIQGT